MIECVRKEDVLTCIIFQVVGKDLTCGELKKIVDNLPTIVIGKESTGEMLIDKELSKIQINLYLFYWDKLTVLFFVYCGRVINFPKTLCLWRQITGGRSLRKNFNEK